MLSSLIILTLLSTGQTSPAQSRSNWYRSTEDQWAFCMSVRFENPLCPQLTSLYEVYSSPEGKLTAENLLRAETLYSLNQPIRPWLESLKLSVAQNKPTQVDELLWNRARWLYAQVLYDHKEYKESVRIFDELNEVFKGKAAFHQQKAWAQYFAGDHKRALGSIISAESPLIAEVPFVKKYLLRALVERDLCRYDRAFAVIAEGREVLSKMKADPKKNKWVKVCLEKTPAYCEQVANWYRKTFQEEVQSALQDLDYLETEMNEKGLKKYSLAAQAKQKKLVWPYAGEAWADELGTYSVEVEAQCSLL